MSNDTEKNKDKSSEPATKAVVSVTAPEKTVEAMTEQSVKAVKAAKKASRKAVKSAAKKTRPKVKKAAAETAAQIQQSNQMMESMMTQGKTQFDKLAQDAAKNGKESVDAFIESGNVFMKGIEDITKTCMSLAQNSAEKNSQVVQAMLGCKTINEFAEAQNRWAQQNFDDFMAGTTKLSELSVKVASDIMEPINDQMNKSIKKVSESLAA